MTFLSAETNHLGSPVELYAFNYGGTQSFYYTSSDELQYVDGIEFVPRAMKRDDIEYTNDIGKAQITIRAQVDLEVTEIFKSGVPSGVVTLTIFRKHRTDTEKAVIWKGRVLGVSWEGNEVSLQCEPIRTSLQVYGLRRNFQRQCPHVLYGVDCRVNNLTFRKYGPVTSVSRTSIVLPAAIISKENGFAGGYVQWTNPENNAQERKTIVSSVAATGQLNLLGVTTGLIVGMNVEAYFGCDKSLSTCSSVFNNEENYGGFPHTPTKNPFGGSPIY